jgi:uncharacterized membrane protein
MKNASASEDTATTAREALYDAVEKNVHLDLNFILLVVLSTVVAAIGLIADNVAVVIGAMVIAPLLGPHLALGFGTALGDLFLIRKALFTSLAGIALAILLSVAVGYFWAFDVESRTHRSYRCGPGFGGPGPGVGRSSRAFVNGRTGQRSGGGMVAVALLPPVATVGLMLGQGNWSLAGGAVLLLAISGRGSLNV